MTLEHGHELLDGGIVPGQRERRRLDDGERAHGIRATGGRQEGDDAAVRMADQVRPVAEHLGHGRGVILEVLPLHHLRRSVAWAVDDDEPESLRERTLPGPRGLAADDAPVDEHDPRTGTPAAHVQSPHERRG